MIRRFCDGCGAEITKDAVGSNRVIRERGRIKVEVHVAIDGTWNSGDACPACVIAVINEGQPTGIARTGWISCGKGPCALNDGHEGRCRT